MSFSPTPPGKATLVSPNGNIGTNNPTYRWNAVSGATWYYLWVDGPSGNVIQKWYTAAEANCTNTTCSVTNATPGLAAGSHTWWIQTWNEAGYGPWSTGMGFANGQAINAQPAVDETLSEPIETPTVAPVDPNGSNTMEPPSGTP
jgi:hypothetical protein